MAPIYRKKVFWQNFPGGPGISNFYFSAPPPLSVVHDFFTGIKANLPSNVLILFERGGDILEDSTGVATGEWQGALDESVSNGGLASNYAAAAGAVVDWSVGGVRLGGRKVIGRTFLVPLNQDSYNNTGSLAGNAQASITTAANKLILDAGGKMVVWSRPRKAPVPPKVGPPARAGSQHVITQASVPSKQAVLRSRRD